MAFRRRKALTQEEINAILFASSSDESDNSENESSNDESSDEVSILCPNAETLPDSDSESEIENDDDSEEMKFTWTADIEQNIDENKFDGNPGPIHDLEPGATALDYFNLFFSDDVCNEIRINTNKYAEFCETKSSKKDKQWTPITDILEVRTFFCIIMIMSLVKMSRLRDYWSTNPILGHDMIKKLMPRNRFFQMLKYFHISDKSEEMNKDSPDFSYLQKLEPLFSTLRDKFQQYFNPYKELSVDEALLKYKGRLGIIQYMPLKPAKRGIKLWMLCTSFLGYVYNFEMYCGRNDKVMRSNNGLGHDVVMHILKPLKNVFHEVYFDRFFTSAPLMRNLFKRKIYGCGTLVSTRKNLPDELKLVKLTEQGSSTVFQCKELKNLLCTVWFDKKQICMLATNNPHEICKVKRRKGPTKNEINCPLSFVKYNKYMGGVDLADQKRKYYSIARKSLKWWYYLFWFLLDTTITNSYIIMITTNFPLPKYPTKLKDFKLQLIEDLAKNITFRKRTAAATDSFTHHDHKRRKINGRKRICISCSKNGRKTNSGRKVESSWECEECGICLCITCF